MATRGVFLYLQTLLIQSAMSRCSPIEPACAPALRYDGLGCCAAPFIPSSGGGSFVVTSSSPVAPTGVSVVSENLYEGTLCAGGNLPWLGSVGVEGEFSTAGAGAVSYGCGDDGVAIVAEEAPVAAVVAPVLTASIALPTYNIPLINGYGLGYGLGYGNGGISYGFHSGLCGGYRSGLYGGYDSGLYGCYGSGLYGTSYGCCGCSI